MKKFLEQLEENLKNQPDKIVLCDDTIPKGITFAQTYSLSGRVYNYLKTHNIGKEDFVMICLPRGIQPIIAMLGVWRAGAAFVLVEDHYAKERIQYIHDNCKCKLTIDSELWHEIQKTPSIDGYEKADEHDAAYAVYTSGTTGNPKGVLHEYGNIERNIESLYLREDGSCIADPESIRFAIPAPLNFVASTLIIVIGLYICGTIFVVSYSTIKNPMSVGLYFIKNRINGTFLTPSYCKMFKKTPGFNLLIVGSEPASNIYFEGVDTFNLYTMSEGGFVVSSFLIDKPYPSTPIGKPSVSDLNIKLIDEEGNDVTDTGEGEIVYYNPYVRGYIDLEEETKKAFIDSYYHTGDIAKKDENGNLVICGRANDMVKINGNRVEPGEIEEATKRVLGIDWCAAKAIEDGDQIYIACYYTDNKVKVDFEKTRKKLEDILPYYMLPSYFIHIDEVPLKQSGKLDRKALPKPNLRDYKGEYIAPRDDIEKALCTAFEKALNIENVGINDDFYQLGGDSLTSMEVLMNSNLKGLNTADIFAGHTPAKIAELYKANHIDDDGVSDEEKDDEAKKKEYPLLPYQLYMIDYQLYTPMSTMLNLFNLAKVDTEIFDIERLCEAVNTCINNHPGLLTKFHFNLDGDIVQNYEESFKADIKVEKLTEEEFNKVKDELVVPFKIMNSKLYRVRVFETEKAGYIFFDVHHTLFDGTSFSILMGDIMKAYADMPLDRDFYYYLLSSQFQLMDSEKFEEDKKYFIDLYKDKEYDGRPKVDFKVRENTLAQKEMPMQEFDERLKVIEEKYDISRNEFFSTVTLLSIAVYNKSKDIMISWTYNGRDNLKKMTSTGLHLKDLPVAISLNRKMKIAEVFESVKDQVKKDIEHSSYPYTMVNSRVIMEDNVCFLYQQDIRDAGLIDGIEQIDIKQNNAASENIMDIQILDGEEGLDFVVDYAASEYKEESIEKFMKLYKAVTDNLLYYAEKNNKKIKKVLKYARKESGLKIWKIK